MEDDFPHQSLVCFKLFLILILFSKDCLPKFISQNTGGVYYIKLVIVVCLGMGEYVSVSWFEG